jgi:hypothetical protein
MVDEQYREMEATAAPVSLEREIKYSNERTFEKHTSFDRFF